MIMCAVNRTDGYYIERMLNATDLVIATMIRDSPPFEGAFCKPPLDKKKKLIHRADKTAGMPVCTNKPRSVSCSSCDHEHVYKLNKNHITATREHCHDILVSVYESEPACFVQHSTAILRKIKYCGCTDVRAGCTKPNRRSCTSKGVMIRAGRSWYRSMDDA